MSGERPDTGRVVGPLDIVTRPLRPYLDDRCIIEIMLNPDGRVWVDRAGQGMSATDTVMAPAEAEVLLRFVATESGTTLTRDKPTLAGTLPHWNARVQGWMPPTVAGPAFTLRKPAPLVFSLDDYVAKGVITPEQRDALIGAVIDRKNILVGGGTGSGKTTFANAVLKAIADHSRDRLYIVEDRPELQCSAPNALVVLTERGKYDTQEAIFDGLRARPDRIIVGELRDGVAHDLLKSWRTGHSGGLATIHADDTTVMLERVCDLIEERVFPANRASVAATIDVCVHLTPDAAAAAGRRISGLDRVVGYDRASERWLLEPLV